MLVPFLSHVYQVIFVLDQRRQNMTYPRAVFGNFIRGMVTYFDSRLSEPMADLIAFAGQNGHIEIGLHPNRELRTVRATSAEGRVIEYRVNDDGDVSRVELTPW